MRRYLTTLTLVGSLTLFVVIASWLLFPSWRATQGGIALLIVVALGGVLATLAGFLKVHQGLQAEDRDKKTPTAAPSGPIFHGPVTQSGETNVIATTVKAEQIGGTRIDKVEQYYEAPSVTVDALHQIPSPPADFTGRADELKKLTDQIKQGGATISGLRGMGGVGKTALARNLAARLATDYPDAQIEINLLGTSKKPLTSSEAMTQVIHAYKPDAKLPENEVELRAAYLSVLHDQRALLLFDNAADAAQVQPLIPPKDCVVLVTSRRHFTLPDLFPLDLDTLLEGDARNLLLHIAPRIGEQAAELAKLCGNLPFHYRTLSARGMSKATGLGRCSFRKCSSRRKPS